MSTISSGGSGLTWTSDATGNLVFSSNVTLGTIVDSTGNTVPSTTVVKGSAKAWVNCSGTTINGSFNVSSITYPTTGRFQINFVTAMPNANYSVVAMGAPATDIGMGCYTGYQPTYGTNSTTACFITTVNVVGPALITPANLYVAVFSS
jgi:hypothetical protein